jgi:hypothetical protein
MDTGKLTGNGVQQATGGLPRNWRDGLMMAVMA